MPDTSVLDLLQALISTPSVNPSLEDGGAGEAGVAELCAGWLRDRGFRVEVTEVVPGRPNVIARHGHGDPVILLNGHLDTVGVGDMTVAPFTPEVRDGRIYGRGSCDMKAGVASLMEAAGRVAAADHPGTVVVALTCDEEYASVGMAALVGGSRGDGGLDASTNVPAPGLAAHGAVVCEPTELALMPAHKGFAWTEVTFTGRAAHGSRPDLGVDAVRHAAAFIAALDDLEAELRSRPPHPLLGHGSLHVGTISGGSAPSVYPDRCTVVVERRTLPGEDAEGTLAEVTELLRVLGERVPELRAEARTTLFRPGTEVPSDHPLHRLARETLRAAGRSDAPRGMTAWVDAAFLNEAGIPAVCFGPGSIARAHTADEFVEEDQVLACADLLEAFLHRALAQRDAWGEAGSGRRSDAAP